MEVNRSKFIYLLFFFSFFVFCQSRDKRLPVFICPPGTGPSFEKFEFAW